MKDTAQDLENKRRRRILFINILSAAVIVAVIIWGIRVFFHLGGSVFTEDAQIEAYINPINTRVPGYLKEIRFSEHQQVKKGDTLAILDAREYKIQQEQAESMYADAQANKEVATSGTDITVSGIQIANANVEELKARLVNMEINFKRYQNLLKDDVVTQFQFDQVKTDLDAMRAKYRSLEAQKQSSSLTNGQTGKRVLVADASIKRAQAALDLASLNLSYTVITAPYDGVVGRKIIEEGQLLQAGQPIVSIVRSNDKWVNANYTEDQLEKLQIGQLVNIKIDAISNKTFKGKIAAISEATGSRYSAIPVDNSTGNFVKVQQRIPVKIEFTNQNSKADLDNLRAGMNVEVTLSN